MPYTYIIGWRKHDKFYYGVRYAKGCSPEDLWVDYFTSSRIVERFRKQHGEPDLVRVHKLFDQEMPARLYEERFLCRVKAASSSRWLNQHNGGKNFCLDFHTDETKLKMKGRIPWNRGIPWSPQIMLKLEQNAYSKVRGSVGPNRGKPLSDEQKQKLRMSRLGVKQSEDLKRSRGLYLPRSPESNEKRSSTMSRKIWCNDGTVSRRFELPQPDGWVVGRLPYKQKVL